MPGLNDHVTNADLIVVPGNTVLPDGTPSPRLRARLDAALHLFRQGRAPLIFVSGGMGKEGFDEAVSMSNYLQSRGVSPASIVMDHLGIDTAATARNAGSYMQANHLKSALVATQYFHVPRTVLALERQGVQVAGTVHARYFEMRDLYSTVRETIAYVAYYAKS
jgi:vancomycin permeability regulator SanA